MQGVLLLSLGNIYVIVGLMEMSLINIIKFDC